MKILNKINCPQNHKYTWEGVTGIPCTQAALRGRFPAPEPVLGPLGGGQGRRERGGAEMLGPLRTVGLSGHLIPQLFILQETVGHSEPQVPHCQTRNKTHPSLPSSG